MESSNNSNQEKEKEEVKSNESITNNINKGEETEKIKNENINQIVENGNQQIAQEEINDNNIIINNNSKQNFEEEKNNEEQKKKTKEDDEILLKEKNQKIYMEKIKKYEKTYDSLFKDIINNWENQLGDSYDKFYDKKVFPALISMFSQPCVICNQEIIILIFKFLCKYFFFLKNNLKSINTKQIYILSMLLEFHKYNLLSLYPKINNNYNYDITNEKFELISDKLFYYLFKEILPNEEIENSLYDNNENCMMKYIKEYLFKIGFIENYIKDFLSRNFHFLDYLKHSFFVFYILNYCDESFILKNNYNINLIRNFTKNANLFLNNSEELIKNNKNSYIKITDFLFNYYYTLIFGPLAYILKKIKEDNLEEEIQNFLFSIFKIFELLLKQQKLELRIYSITHFSSFCNYYKNYYESYKKYYNDYKNVFEYSKKVFLSFLIKINIFDYIFGENIHEALIERCFDIISFLYKNNSFPSEQISLLWKISQSKYQSINNSIITLFGKILPEFSKEDCNTILEIIWNIDLKEVNEVTLKLLENFFLSEHRHEKLLNILFKYSNELSFYEGLSSNIINKSRSILIKLLFNKKYADDLIKCFKNSIFCLNNNYLLNTNGQIFLDIMNEFIKSEKVGNTIQIFKKINENIENFGILISYLDEKYSIFSILMNVLLFFKKLFMFFSQESVRIKKLSTEDNFDLNNELDINKFLLKYKKYSNGDDYNENSKDQNNKNEIKTSRKKCSIMNNYFFPKDKNDIDKYYEIIIIDFINFLKNNILKKDINLTENDIIFKIFTQFEFSSNKSTYHKILYKIISSNFSFHEFGNNYIKRNLLDLLFNLLVDNSLYSGEKEIFFNFIKDILVFQFNNNNLNLITNENIEYICLEKILSYDIKNLPYSAYEAMNLFLVNINEKNGNIIYSRTTNKFTEIKKINILVGFKTILEFYIYNNDINISMNALSTLTNILEIASSDIVNRKYLLNELFLLLEKYKIKIKENIYNSEIKIVFRRLLRLISIVNKSKVSKNLYDEKDPSNLLNLKINNNYFNNNEDNKFVNLTVFKGLTVKEFKNELIDKIICNNNEVISLFRNMFADPYQNICSLDQIKEYIKNSNSISLYYNDSVLKDNFTLADYEIKSGENILILNTGSSQGMEEFTMSEEQLKEGYEQINVVFNDKYSKEIMKEALYNQRGDIQNAIIYLTNENNILNLVNEIEKKKNDTPKRKEETVCLEENRFNLLLDILNEGDNDLNDCIWDLFSEIKFPEKFINSSIENDFQNIYEEKNLNKKMLILKIVNSVIFGDNSFCKNNKLNKKVKNNWISKFINNEVFILKILKLVLEIKIEKKSEINYSEVIDIIINFFYKIFSKIKDLNKNKAENKRNNNEKEIENNNKEVEEYGEFDVIEKEGDNFMKLLSKNNFVNLIYNIIGIALELKKVQTKSTKKRIIKNIYDILIEYFALNQNDIFQFLDEENKAKKIINILTSEDEIDIRKSTFDFIKKLIETLKQKNKEKAINIQSSLFNTYYPYLISDEIYQEEFYELFNYLFNLESLKQNTIEIDKIIEKFLDNIWNFYNNNRLLNINEKDNSDKIIKKLKYNLYMLCSFSPFYNELLEKEIDKKMTDNKDIISVIYKCLFEIKRNENNNYNYLFSDQQLRQNSLSLLSNLISIDKKYFEILFSRVILHHNNILEIKYELPLDYPLRKQSQKFLGLKNLGATCYLNSLLQQMFMIPTFQKDIFDFNIMDEEKNIKDLQNSTIYNMQITFANLKKSIMAYYPPNSFIESFKTAFNGEPIRLGIQQDTDEFLSILCDQLEKEAKKYGKEYFLENSLKGKITNEIVSLENEYPYYSQTEEPFYRITLDIKGHKNLEDALDAFVKGEILDGDNKYYVEKYQKKISIKKRTTLKKIGNVIIIHLKRFEFDFVTFQNNKLNDYLKFPLKLNLKKWTRAFLRKNEVNDENDKNISEEEKENLDDDKMNYELTGILVHSGANLQNGHYYSFIKDQETGEWFIFNDNSISDYNIDTDLEKECFGNIDSQVNQYGKGAYLLFYTKKECVEKNKNYNNEIKINEKILKEVEIGNINFMNIKSYSSDDYHKFFMKFINCSLNYLKTEKNDNNNDTQNIINDNEYSLLINKNLDYQVKIYEKIMENKENKIEIIEEKTILPDNIEKIYEKYKREIISKEQNNKEKSELNLKEQNINMDTIIKLFFYYSFGIVFNFNNKEAKMIDCVDFIKELLSKNLFYSVNIMKLIENRVNIFFNLLFKYGYIDKDMTGINLQIYTLYKTLFHSIYNFEKEKYQSIPTELYRFLDKDESGKLIPKVTPKSLFLRVFDEIFCINFEKCRKKYSIDSLFLNLFLLITISFPESCLVSSNNLINLISFITNNTFPEYKSPIDPNYKMGNPPNAYYISIFSEIILRCATPWMQKNKKESPYFIKTSPNIENRNLIEYPKLPNDWKKILTKKFFLDYILANNNVNSGQIICHLCYEDKSTSVTILKLVNNFLKQKFYHYPEIENISLNTLKIFEINDSFTQIRLETLFELEGEKNTLINFYINQKYNLPALVLEGLFIFSVAIQKYDNVYEYLKKNKNKLGWVNEYYTEFFMVSNTLYQYLEGILHHHPNLFEIIECQLINRLFI